MLTDSLHAWKNDGHDVVWLDVPIELAQLIPPATAAGFIFHHSTERTLTLLYTFEKEATVPTYATHYIGAGGVVFNKRRELLVVSEWHRRDRSQPYYKLPGGALYPGEHLIAGVVREVQEETGVRRSVRGVDLLSTLAWLSLEQIRHLFHLPADRPKRRHHHPAKRN